MSNKLNKSDEQWRQELEDDAFRVLREKGTEPAFTGKYVDEKRAGTYRCAGCGEPLFASDTKFDSGSGWPSFYLPADAAAVETHTDRSHGMVRTEVTCRKCDGHLGHLFDDGPAPTGQRYCINSCSLSFDPKNGPDRGDK